MSLGPSVVPTNANVWVANGGYWAIPGAFQRHPWTSVQVRKILEPCWSSQVEFRKVLRFLRFRTHFQIWNTFQIQGVHEVEEVDTKVLGRKGDRDKLGKCWKAGRKASCQWNSEKTYKDFNTCDFDGHREVHVTAPDGPTPSSVHWDLEPVLTCKSLCSMK